MLNVTKIDENVSAIVQWDAVEDSLLTEYTVNWTSITIPMQSATVTDQSSYTITGLTLDTVYTVIVSATDKCGTSPESTASITISTGAYHFIIFKARYTLARDCLSVAVTCVSTCLCIHP